MKKTEYSVGLDIGTGSVGWAVIGDDYKLISAKGKNLIGVRLFEGAETAEERRGYRTTRRRLSRRHWRLNLLNEFFSSELQLVDNNFLARLKYSWVHPDDTNNPHFGAGIFADQIKEKEFYSKYPTIYHLRHELMIDTKQHDLREIYLAIHHIVKYRGHFLNAANQMSAKNSFNVTAFIHAMEEYNADTENIFATIINPEKFSLALTNHNARNKTVRVEDAMQFIEGDKLALKAMKAVLTGLVGNVANIETIFSIPDLDKDEKKLFKLNFDVEDRDTLLELIREKLSVEQAEMLDAIIEAYEGITLKMILGEHTSISASMIEKYKAHHEDWEFIKANIRNRENKDEINTAYKAVLSVDENLHKDGLKVFKKLISAAEIVENDKADLLNKIENDEFLPRQRTKQNGILPHQLHLAELEAIIEKQKKYYPFLAEEYTQEGKTQTKLAGLLKFRVPYYVGPLVEADKVAGDGTNHWLIRKSNASQNITPWNFADIVDKDASGEAFISRLTGTDTYLIGEPTLPEKSLLYQDYNVLQELNNVRDENHRRLDVRTKQAIFEKVFKIHNKISAQVVEEFILSQTGKKFEINGLADTKSNTFNNQLSTYNFFVSVLGREKVETLSPQLLEELVMVQTVFEDREIRLRRLAQPQFAVFSADEKEKLAAKHYTGWGRLSQKLLTSKFIEINLETAGDVVPQKHSIFELLYHTDQNLMEILNNGDYGVQDWLNEQNSVQEENAIKEQIEALAGPKNIKRGITQVFRILEDLRKVLGGNPEKVYIEFAREPQNTGITNSRLRRVQDLYSSASLNETFKDLAASLAEQTKESIQDDRLYLYYLQEGKDMYTGEPIELEHLSEWYDIDHIIPQAFTKDNSLDNRVLVNRGTNARKADSPTYTDDIITKRKSWWKSLLELELISKSKYERLTNRKGDFSEAQTSRFIARQLVETRQIIKNVANLIDVNYAAEGKHITTAVKASLTAEMRRYIAWPKNRDINDYHHAHDALLMATVGKYIDRRGFFSKGRVSDAAGNSYYRYTKDWMKKVRSGAKDDSVRIQPYGFIVGSMNSKDIQQQVNQDTGEIVWSDASREYIWKVMDYSKILVTKRSSDQTGQLYNESRYQSKLHDVKSKGKFAFDKHKSVDLYGGFDSAKPAYAALVFTKKKYRLVNVLREWVENARGNDEFLINKIREMYPDAKLVLNHIPYGQVLVKDGALVTVSSATELHNFQQLYLSREEYKKISQLLKAQHEKMGDNDNFLEAFDLIMTHAKKYYPLHQNALTKVEMKRADFETLSFEDKQQTLSRILLALHANPSNTDLKKIKASGEFGRLKNTGVLNEHDLFVYQSATGLFEQKYTVEELAKRANL
ncbi:type II CRISPR RNA-guided endonuclease Cas9 [Periweissella cryptocerci]|uniref:CRISPR-associated endonuclease Cas9 n=1 Tax=Periweissella cryptocerci TaxID=2506420 RepID=A0A4P6YVW5_9LACO|nr:type II CRISPR RNA-guided endonuclease Cas9 [Periweissella cryptocerci]QBO36921.1 type II CRISPR RNA-guided endonuclease Cas9 [Periweissella cryptocerci]